MSTWTVFWEAAKETPKLYFAPIHAMLGVTRDVQAQMLKTHGKILGAKTYDRSVNSSKSGK